LRQKLRQEVVIQQKECQHQHKVIEECVVRRQDDAELPGRYDEKADNPPPPWQKKHPDEH
jgi:hypothetical protein